MNKKTLLLLVLLVCLVGSVYAMDVSVVTGTKIGLDVKQDFGKATITISPETATSLVKQFTQTIKIENKYDDSYFFINPIYPKSLKSFSITEISPYSVDVPNMIETCVNKTAPNLTNILECTTTQQGTTKEIRYTENKISNNYANWGSKQQFYTNTGTLIKNGETKLFKINYETYDNYNKFDIRVWANTKNDYTCILDNQNNCLYSYTIDPTYNLTNGIVNYLKLDETVGTNANDEVGTNDGILGSGASWTTGKINNGISLTGGVNGFVNYTNWLSGTDFWNQPYTICMWIYANSFDSTYGDLLFWPGNKNQQHIIATTKKIEITTYDGTVAQVISNTVLNITTWYFICLQRTGSTSGKVWLNGVDDTSGTNTMKASANTLAYNMSLGCRTDGTNANFDGIIDEVGIWNRTLNSSEISYLYNSGIGLQYPFILPDTGNYTVTVVNQTYNSSLFETRNYDYLINVSFGANVSNITGMTLNALNYSFTASIQSNGTLTNQTWRVYNVSDVRPDLVLVNGTVFPFNWTFTTRLDNGTNYSNVTSNINQNVLWAYYPINIFMEAQAIETRNTTWNNSYTLLGNSSDVSFVYMTNYTAYTTSVINSTNVVQNGSTNQNVSFYFTVPFLNSTDNNKQYVMLPYLNVSFNGTTLTRNTSVSANQGVYKILITNCSNVSFTNETTYQIYVRDIVTDNLLSANTNFNFTLWLTENFGVSGLNRTYSFSFNSNSSPRLCIYPTSNVTPLLSYSYSGYKEYSASLTGYLTSSGNDSVVLSNVSQTSTIYLTNASAVQEVTITITDQNDNELTNYTVRAYLYQNGSYSLVDTEVSNLQGQVRFNLYITDRLYQFRVSYPNGTLAKTSPENGGTTIISTSFTIKIYLSPIASLITSVNMQNINHSLTYNNVSGLVNLTFNDTSTNFTSYNCLKILNVSSGLLIYNNCTTNQTGTFLYTLTGNGSFVASYTAINAEDGEMYLIDNLFITRGSFEDLAQEGVFWAFIFIGTITMIGLMINPILGVIFLEFGVIASYLIGILPLTYGALLSILATGLLVAFIMGRE